MAQFNLKAGLRIRIIRGTFSCRLESYLRNGSFMGQNFSILPAVGKTLAVTELMTSAVTKNETCCFLMAVGMCKDAISSSHGDREILFPVRSPKPSTEKACEVST